MTKTVEAVYENGVLRPLEALALRDNQRVTLTLSDQDERAWPDSKFLEYLDVEADDAVTLAQVRAALVKIPGSLADDFRQERDERF